MQTSVLEEIVAMMLLFSSFITELCATYRDEETLYFVLNPICTPCIVVETTMAVFHLGSTIRQVPYSLFSTCINDSGFIEI